MVALSPKFEFAPSAPWPEFLDIVSYLLKEAELEFGPAQPGRILHAVYADGSCVTCVSGTEIFVHIDGWCIGDLPQSFFQLSHELFHVLSQCDGVPRTRLEEGLATYFSMKHTWKRYANANLGPPHGSDYDLAFRKAEELLKIDAAAIRMVRAKQSVVSLITKQEIVDACSGCAPQLAEWLTQPFDLPAPP